MWKKYNELLLPWLNWHETNQLLSIKTCYWKIWHGAHMIITFPNLPKLHFGWTTSPLSWYSIWMHLKTLWERCPFWLKPLKKLTQICYEFVKKSRWKRKKSSSLIENKSNPIADMAETSDLKELLLLELECPVCTSTMIGTRLPQVMLISRKT